MLRVHSLLSVSLVFLAPVPALADVVFSDSTFNPANYTQTPVYATPGSSIVVSKAGGGIEAVGTATATQSGAGLVETGVVNKTFTYNPSTQGAILALSASVTTNLTISPAQAQPAYLSGADILLEQGGQYFVAHIAGPNFTGQSSGSLTLSAAGLTASAFTLWNTATGGGSSGTPDFAGGPITFGMFYNCYSIGSIVCTEIDSNRTFDLVTASTPAQLSASPAALDFTAEAGSGAALQQTITVSNSGGASAAFTASVESASPWVSVSPASGTAAPGSPVLLTVTVNPHSLSAGSYRDVIDIASPNGAASIPVSLFVQNSGPVLFAGPDGLLFTMIQGAGSSLGQSVTIANQGSSGSTVNWTAAPATGPGIPNGNFLAIGASSGNVQTGNPFNLPVTLNDNASNLAPGVYYELLQISAPGAQNSPQYVTAVFQVIPSSGTVSPTVNPGGLVFVGRAGESIPAQPLTVNWNSPLAEPFPISASTANGQPWLTVSPSTVTALAQVPAMETVSVNTAGLSAGIYTGLVALDNGVFGSVNVTLVLTAGVQTEVHTLAQAQAVSGCTPSAVVLTETGIPNSFSVPAGWPAELAVTMTDDCGNPVNNGAVAAAFSDGDPPLPLSSLASGGQYLAVWQPMQATDTVIRLTGTAAPLAPASIQLSGYVTANQAPVLAPNGILNNLNPQVGGALAPGTVAAAFGTGLTTSSSPVSPGESPLPEEFENTQLIVGGYAAPLYFLSNTQLNVEIPAQLAALQRYQAVSVVNGALSLPVTISLAPMAPGVAANTDGSVIGQHSDYSLVTSSSPAHPGESIVIYLVGMGATSPAVASGAAAPGTSPGQSLAKVVVQPVVELNNQAAQVQFAGLTPGAVGLYQINFTVPASAPAGNLSLTVSQGGAQANATTLPVAIQ